MNRSNMIDALKCAIKIRNEFGVKYFDDQMFIGEHELKQVEGNVFKWFVSLIIPENLANELKETSEEINAEGVVLLDYSIGYTQTNHRAIWFEMETVCEDNFSFTQPLYENITKLVKHFSSAL